MVRGFEGGGEVWRGGGDAFGWFFGWFKKTVFLYVLVDFIAAIVVFICFFWGKWRCFCWVLEECFD